MSRITKAEIVGYHEEYLDEIMVKLADLRDLTECEDRELSEAAGAAYDLLARHRRNRKYRRAK